MQSRTLVANRFSAKDMGEHPRPKWGLWSSNGVMLRVAKLREEKGRLAAAGIGYAEAGRHSHAFKVAKRLLESPERTGGDESNLLGAARIIIALYKATGEPAWAGCAERMGAWAQQNGMLEDAALIFEESGFESAADIVRSQLRLSIWADGVGATKPQ
ncbi:MAG: hypothetical protein PHQ80_04235 [Candidatus ainarchaeum sp.]|nr:hypothetical protein [Candidatus ainarchaeum sp.]MDD5096644.1 hypothetical protein [Candidatus ainarchaeum sp.]